MAMLVLILLILAGLAAGAVALGFVGRFDAVRVLALSVLLLVVIAVLDRV